MPCRSPSARWSWMDSCQSAGKDAVQCQERVPCTVPGALPGEAAAPALGCSCSPPPCSPDPPHGEAVPLQQALTRPPSTSCPSQLQAGFGTANPRFFTPFWLLQTLCVPRAQMCPEQGSLLQWEVLYNPPLRSHAVSFARSMPYSRRGP